jgi:hypothetical protein
MSDDGGHRHEPASILIRGMLVADPGRAEDEPTTILLTGPGETAGDPTTIQPASPGEATNEPTTILLAGPGQDADEPTTILLTAPGAAAGEPTTILLTASGAVAGEPTTILQPMHDAGSAGPALAALAPPEWRAGGGHADQDTGPLTAAGPVLPDYLDDETTTISGPVVAGALADTGAKAAVAEAGREPAPEPPDVTELMPTPAAASPVAPGQPWFDGLLTAFIGALRQDETGQPRPPEARQALAAAARDTIARVAMQGVSGAGWASDTVLQPDQLLANTYIVRALIARGGIGEIFRARHRDLKTEHAIKILLPRYALDPTMLTLMLEEARLLQSVRHEAVVGCQDLLRDIDGRPMLVMDYLRGRTLSSRLREGRLSDADLRALTCRLADGLAAIHDAGIVHQDISPDNVILLEDSCAAATMVRAMCTGSWILQASFHGRRPNNYPAGG